MVYRSIYETNREGDELKPAGTYFIANERKTGSPTETGQEMC